MWINGGIQSRAKILSDNPWLLYLKSSEWIVSNISVFTFKQLKVF